MSWVSRFIVVMKSELLGKPKPRRRSAWVVGESKCLTIEEVRKLKSVCEQGKAYGLQHHKFSPVRNWFMVELGLNAGLRIEEMCSLRCGNLLLDTSKSSILVTGKGQKTRPVTISYGFKKTCQEFLRYKQQFGYGINPEDYVLTNLQGNRISTRALEKFFKLIVARAGLPSRYYPHCLRHTYSTFLLAASNNNYEFVRRQLGHESIRTTQVYAGVVDQTARKALNSLDRLYG